MPKKIVKTALCCSLAAMLLAAPEVKAEDDLQAQEVKVTATRTERYLAEVPMSVGVVTAEDQQRNPQTSVAEMLANIPGVTVMDGSMPGAKRVKIRGESSERSLILIDGVKVSEQKSMSGAAILVDTSQIERIEVIKGPASVLYGTEAIGGVINIITKKGGPKPIGFSQQLTYDTSNNGFELQNAIFGSYNGFNYRFTASGKNTDDMWSGDGRIADSDYKTRSYSGQVGYTWDKGEVFLKADRYESDINIPVNTSSGDIKFGSYSGMSNRTDVTLDLPKWNRDTISGGFELRELNDYLAKIKINGFAQNMEKNFRNNVHVYNEAATAMGAMIVEVDQNIKTVNDQDSYGGSAQTEWTFGDHYVIAGLDYYLDKLDAKDLRLGGYTYIKSPISAGRYVYSDAASYRYKVEQQNIGAFIQDEWAFHEDWTATLGLRQTWVNSEIKKNNNPDLESHNDSSDRKTVGNLGLVYSGIEDVALRAMWSQGYRFPALNQLYLGTVHGSTSNTLPNPNLKPETSNNYEIGARINKGNLNVDVAAFYTDSKNYITTKKLNNAAEDSQFANMDKAKTYGLELATDYKIEELWNLTPYATVTWLHREYENKVALVDDGTSRFTTSKTGTSPIQGTFGLRWDQEVLEKTNLYTDAYVRWAAHAKTYDYDSDYEGDFVTTKDPGWATLNFTVGLYGGEEHKWNVSVALRNILDKTYREADNTLESAGFHAILSAGYEF